MADHENGRSLDDVALDDLVADFERALRAARAAAGGATSERATEPGVDASNGRAAEHDPTGAATAQPDPTLV